MGGKFSTTPSRMPARTLNIDAILHFGDAQYSTDFVIGTVGKLFEHKRFIIIYVGDYKCDQLHRLLFTLQCLYYLSAYI